MNFWIFQIKNTEVIFCSLAALFLVSAADGEAEFVCAGADIVHNGSSASKSHAITTSTQTLNALVIFAAFDQAGSAPPVVPGFSEEIFDRVRPGSLTHFYSTMSAGKLLVKGFMLPRRYQSDGPSSAYVASAVDQRGLYGQFVREILRKADGDFNFAEFDNDGPDDLLNSGDDDGFVDYIFVNLASTPARFFIGNATGVGGLGLDEPYLSEDLGVDGQPIQVFGLSSGDSVLREGNFQQTMDVMAHELGHYLGLPDLFDRSYPSPAEDSAGIGRWGLMGWAPLAGMGMTARTPSAPGAWSVWAGSESTINALWRLAASTRSLPLLPRAREVMSTSWQPRIPSSTSSSSTVGPVRITTSAVCQLTAC